MVKKARWRFSASPLSSATLQAMPIVSRFACASVKEMRLSAFVCRGGVAYECFFKGRNMISRAWIVVALLGSGAAFAATPTAAAKAQYNADAKKAASQYAADKKDCTTEQDANARLQCRRDAKTVYDQTLLKAKANMNATATAQPVSKACADCGTVSAVTVLEKEGEGSAVGMIAGGVGGALLGNQVGGGIGKDLATVAGAVGGAYAGKKIEEKVRSHKVWTVTVQYPDKSEKNFEFKEDPKYQTGDLVKNAGDSITRR
jgi:outer membrane lipoprotein SlyB